jgi:ATP-binding cassette subfamily F protein uup
MDAPSAKSENDKSKSRQDDFMKSKKSTKSPSRNKVELEINMERMGSKIIELLKISKIQGSCDHG